VTGQSDTVVLSLG
jgi:hypothetical protein